LNRRFCGKRHRCFVVPVVGEEWLCRRSGDFGRSRAPAAAEHGHSLEEELRILICMARFTSPASITKTTRADGGLRRVMGGAWVCPMV
jgi:hypothetical protein